jgi:hypothetical protein
MEHSNSNDVVSVFQSRQIKILLYVIGTLAVLLLVFQAGVSVGYRRAMFSYKWSQNYPNNFFPPPPMDMMKQFDNKGFIRGHGVLGEIVKVDSSTLIVKERGEVEKSVLVKSDTVIEGDFENLKITDLKAGLKVIVVGSPSDSGQIEAKIIRVLPNALPINEIRK